MLKRIIPKVRLPIVIASASLPRSSFIRATSAVSIAVSLPMAPIAIPTLATANAGASFTPSPIIPTLPCLTIISRKRVTLSSGIMSPKASSMPASLAIASTVRWLSPLSITIRSSPAVWSEASALRASPRSASPMEITPRISPGTPSEGRRPRTASESPLDSIPASFASRSSPHRPLA